MLGFRRWRVSWGLRHDYEILGVHLEAYDQTARVPSNRFENLLYENILSGIIPVNISNSGCPNFSMAPRIPRRSTPARSLDPPTPVSVHDLEMSGSLGLVRILGSDCRMYSF